MNKPVIIPSKTNNKNMERYLHRKLSGAEEGGGSSEAIKFTEQELTEEQKAQARRNINAANDSEVVKHVSQNLTSEQQAQVRENIGAGDAETVQELDEKVNGSMVTKWTVLEAESTITGKGLRSLSTSSTTSIFDKTNFSVAIFRVANGNTVRITAKKPAGSMFGPNPSDFFAYSSSSQATTFDRVASGEAKESTSAGTITNFEFLCSSDGYLAVVGDSSTPPKCEVLNNEHVPGLEERVTDLEQKVGEDTLDDTPTKSSDNLVKSGGVYSEIHPIIVTTQPAGGFLPNVFYNLGELTGSVTFALATPSDNTIVNHYYWTFETGSTAPTITWPNGITWLGGSAPEISASKHYEISVLNSIGTFMEV